MPFRMYQLSLSIFLPFSDVSIRFLVQYVPAWAGATFRKQAAEWRKVLDTMINRPFNAVEAAMVSNVLQESVSDSYLFYFIRKKV